MEKTYVSVHLLDTLYTLDKPYEYRLPEQMRSSVKEGSLLVVPFGRSNKHVSAVAVSFSDTSTYPRVKEVLQVLDYPFDIPEEFPALCRFMKERFFCTYGQAFRAILPPGINLRTEVYYVSSAAEMPESLSETAYGLLRRVREAGEITALTVSEDFGAEGEQTVASLTEQGILEKKTRVQKTINEKSVTTVKLCISQEEASELLEEDSKLTEKQKVLIELLMHYPYATPHELAEIGGISTAVISGLVRKGLVEKQTTRVSREEQPEEDWKPAEKPNLSNEQSEALRTLVELEDSGKPQAALLYGVTGSGKTKVIIEAVRHALDCGKTAIILLPEIGLTAQATGVYRSVFGKEMTVIHSMLSVGERLDAFRAMREGKIKVVLGTRSAVFSPLDNLGVLAIDEEQEATYKSELSPKYHARDIARFRCVQNNALLLLASATPSIESFYKATTGAYTLVTLTERFGGAKLPEVRIEDLRNDSGSFPDKLIGTSLLEELQKTLQNKRQSILFANRRGYQPHTSCRSCGYVFTCPNCSISLTYHAYEGLRRSDGKLACHYCGYVMPLPSKCPSCGGNHIGFSGFGTQKLQEELEERLPEARILRMDADTTTEKHSHDRILKTFGDGDADILFGTQMVSKGLDFPAVDVVGVISVDSSLYQNDFRAGERTFSLVTQLVGRAGRSDRNGLAILQTYNPDNEILNLAAQQDYEAFYASEVILRRAVFFPPFCSILVFTVSAVSEADCAAFASRFAKLYEEAKEKAGDTVKIQKFGPYPSGIYRIGNRFRQRVILKYSDNAAARQFFASLYETGLKECPDSVRLDADANPMVV